MLQHCFTLGRKSLLVTIVHKTIETFTALNKHDLVKLLCSPGGSRLCSPGGSRLDGDVSAN